MKPLRSALGAWEPAAEAAGDPLLRIKAAWPAIVGRDVAANARPHEIVRDTLLVVTRSSGWSQQLALLGERILSQLREQTGLTISRLRFRVGRVAEATQAPGRRRTSRPAQPGHEQDPAPTLEAALERFRSDVASRQRAKAAAGWKECGRCGAAILPASRAFCMPCANARTQERDGTVARLLYEVPWLGYAGIAALVEELTLQEYHAIRARLLRRWRDALERVRRGGGERVTLRDRMIASSYVLLKSELQPERIAPAVVRDLLGEDLYDIFYGKENT